MSKRIGVMLQHPEVWDEFREYVVRKWGKKHTVLALELEQAIIEYISKRKKEGVQVQLGGDTHANSKVSKTMKTLSRIAEKLNSQYPKEATQSDVERVITDVAGGHRDTLQKYLRLLKEYGFIVEDRKICGLEKFIFKIGGGFEVKTDSPRGVHTL